MADNKEIKSFSKTIQTVIISLAVIAVAAGSVAYGIHFVMQNEGIYEISEHRESKTVISFNTSKKQITEYVKNLVNSLADPTTAKVKYKKTFSVDKNSITCADEAFAKDLKVAFSSITDNIRKNYFPDFEGAFGESAADILPAFQLSAKDVDFAFISEAVSTQDELEELFCDKCVVVTDEEYKAATDKNYLVKQSFIDEFLKKCKDDTENRYYYIHIRAKGGTLENVLTGNIGNTFKIDEAYGKFEMIKADVANELSVNTNVVCDELTVDLKVDRFNDTIVSLDYNASYTVDADAFFMGSLANYGQQNVTFSFSTKTSYTPTYAGLHITDNVIYIEKGDEKEIANTFNVEDKDEESAVLTWTSENPDVVHVTENGYITGKQYCSTPVKVYGHAEYLGKTYDVCCDVYVINPVKNITLDEKELVMQQGITHQLTYILDPVDATITDAYWISTDESVATVDENGIVTATGVGACSIIAVSKNENFKSTCIITVE